MSSDEQEEFAFNGSNPDPESREESEPSDRRGGGSTPAGNTPDPLRDMMDRNFLEYASYVICDRAIPNIEDGLKPVQRRILHSLHENDDGRFIKVANIVGHTMQYHPHGDASIGDALVALTNRGYLIEGQGNFGNIFTGDRAAATRYIECRLTDLAREQLFNTELTRMTPSYDGRRKEPVTLPCKLPLLLMLGADGIAVGLSTRIFPHNFGELLEAQIAILQKKKFSVLPDFPQGGLMDVSEYEGGNGRIRTRACIKTAGDNKLVITELPFGATTESLIASIEDATRKKKVPVKLIDDFTAEVVSIELTLNPDTRPERAIEALFAFTACESAVTGRPTVIRDNRPVEMTVEEILRENTAQLVRILQKELQLRKRKLTDELHAKTLVQLFIEERIYKRIEECKTAPSVEKAVLEGLAPFRAQLVRDVTHDDVEMLLQVRIRRISLFDIGKNREQMAAIVKELGEIEKQLGDLVNYAIRYVRALHKKVAPLYPRQTKVTRFSSIEVRDLTARELQMFHDGEKGYIGSAVTGAPLFCCSSYDRIVVVWRDGRYKIMPPPDKLFVDKTMLYCAPYERDRVMTVVYTHHDFTYLKRFTFGGFILNKEYLCTPEPADILLFDADAPTEIYMKYAEAKRQRIHQARFQTDDVPVQNVKARGSQLTAKTIDRLAVKKPRWWRDDETTPRGVMLDF